MKKLFLILTLFCALYSSAQNLVPNGDFEYYNTCPTGYNQLSNAFPWYDPNGSTPDYYNACAAVSNYVSVPIQEPGTFQYALSGVGYAGLYSADLVTSNYREYIQVQLLDTLHNLKCYAVSFYSNLNNIGKIGTNNLGVYISQAAVTCPQYMPYGLTPQILSLGNPPITDTVNWIKISGLYIATGGEHYITIGNFNYDSTTLTQIVYPSNNWTAAYYYIDDVSIYEIKTSNAGRDTTLCHGDSAMLGTNNYDGVTYNWQPTTGLSNANIGNPMASPASTTTYYLTQTTPCAVSVDTVVVSVCGIGINEIENDKYFKVYPNPCATQLIIDNGKLLIKEIKIVNVLGEAVLNQQPTNNNKQLTIDMTGYAKGIYFVQIQTEKGTTNKKIIIQ